MLYGPQEVLSMFIPHDGFLFVSDSGAANPCVVHPRAIMPALSAALIKRATLFLYHEVPHLLWNLLRSPAPAESNNTSTHPFRHRSGHGGEEGAAGQGGEGGPGGRPGDNWRRCDTNFGQHGQRGTHGPDRPAWHERYISYSPRGAVADAGYAT